MRGRHGGLFYTARVACATRSPRVERLLPIEHDRTKHALRAPVEPLPEVEKHVLRPESTSRLGHDPSILLRKIGLVPLEVIIQRGPGSRDPTTTSNPTSNTTSNPTSNMRASSCQLGSCHSGRRLASLSAGLAGSPWSWSSLRFVRTTTMETRLRFQTLLCGREGDRPARSACQDSRQRAQGSGDTRQQELLPSALRGAAQ